MVPKLDGESRVLLNKARDIVVLYLLQVVGFEQSNEVLFQNRCPL